MTPPQPEPKVVTNLNEAMRQGNLDAGVGGAYPASQPVPGEMPEPEVTEEDAVQEDAGEGEAAEEPTEGAPEGEVPAAEPEAATEEGGA